MLHLVQARAHHAEITIQIHRLIQFMREVLIPLAFEDGDVCLENGRQRPVLAE